jgi:hypothetical protein
LIWSLETTSAPIVAAGPSSAPAAAAHVLRGRTSSETAFDGARGVPGVIAAPLMPGTASRGSAVSTWRVSVTAMIESRQHRMGALTDPTASCHGCGKASGSCSAHIFEVPPTAAAEASENWPHKRERGAGAQLLNDAIGIGRVPRSGFRSRRNEDFGNAIFLAAAGGIEARDDRLHFFFGDVHERLDAAALEPAPGDLTVDLALDGGVGRPGRAQEGGELLRRLLEVLGVTAEILIELALFDLDVFGLGRLDLQRLVHQVAQHLLAQPRLLLGRDAAAVGETDEGDAVIDIGAGDDVAVDDRGGLANRRIVIAEEKRVLRNAESGLRPGLAARLRNGGRGGQRSGQYESRPLKCPELHHSSSKSRLLRMPMAC